MKSTLKLRERAESLANDKKMAIARAKTLQFKETDYLNVQCLLAVIPRCNVFLPHGSQTVPSNEFFL